MIWLVLGVLAILATMSTAGADDQSSDTSDDGTVDDGVIQDAQDDMKNGTQNAVIRVWANANAKMEGFYKVGSISQRNNNPGNLRTWPNTPTVSGYASFETEDAGWHALFTDLATHTRRNPGQSFLVFYAGDGRAWPGYAPKKDSNNPSRYAAFVVGQINGTLATDFTVNTTIGAAVNS